jgi:hypothetical protein
MPQVPFAELLLAGLSPMHTNKTGDLTFAKL